MCIKSVNIPETSDSVVSCFYIKLYIFKDVNSYRLKFVT